MEDYFEIGIITAPRGVRGEVRVYPTTDDPKRFSLLDEVRVVCAGGPDAVYAIESARYSNGLVLLKLAGVDSVSAALKLKNAVIKIPPHKALPLGEGEYYRRDLLGMKAFTADGVYVGEITGIIETGANDVYEIKDGRKTILIPAIKDCVNEVDVAAGSMVVTVLEGLAGK